MFKRLIDPCLKNDRECNDGECQDCHLEIMIEYQSRLSEREETALVILEYIRKIENQYTGAEQSGIIKMWFELEQFFIKEGVIKGGR